MSWLVLSVLGYAFLALVAVGDKYLIANKTVADPKLYTFYMSVLGFLVLLAVPFLGFPVFGREVLIINLVAGGLYTVGAFLLFTGLSWYEASRIIPANGALKPVFTLVLGYFILPDISIKYFELLAFALLVLGSLVVTWQRKKSLHMPAFFMAFLISFFFTASYVFAKLGFVDGDFWGGFLWQRIGAGILGLAFLLYPEVRSKLFALFSKHSEREKEKGWWGGLLYVGNQALGAISIILILKAVQVATTSQFVFIEAMQGVQYLFLMLFIFLILKLSPNSPVKEHLSGNSLTQKLLGVSIIVLGFIIYGIS